MPQPENSATPMEVSNPTHQHSPAHTDSDQEDVALKGVVTTRPSWQSIKCKISLSEKTSSQLGWIVAVLSVLFTVVALSPPFKAQDAAEEALRLAKWTAFKDYIDACKDELAAGSQSQACQRAVGANLPPPPYVALSIVERLQRQYPSISNKTINTTIRERPDHHLALKARLPRELQWLIMLRVVLTISVFAFLSFESSRSRVRNRVYAATAVDEETRSHSYPTVKSSSGSAYSNSDPGQLRQRRLSVGHEDVKRHWPYLIYSLAYPNHIQSPKRLIIAQFCLRYGADVNVLKDWNGQSTLMIAIHFGNVAVARFLIENGASVCYAPPDSGSPAVHRCARLAVTGSTFDALGLMRMLFQYGADANHTDALGETPLHELMIDAWFDKDATDTLTPAA